MTKFCSPVVVDSAPLVCIALLFFLFPSFQECHFLLMWGLWFRIWQPALLFRSGAAAS